MINAKEYLAQLYQKIKEQGDEAITDEEFATLIGKASFEYETERVARACDVSMHIIKDWINVKIHNPPIIKQVALKGIEKLIEHDQQ